MEERKKQVLNAIIKDYIVNAEPVGSRAVAKKYNLGVSPATIRNEMSDLEEEGYIEQPHTSAGRVPSGKGYRFYVDNLMQREKLSVNQLDQIKDVLSGQLDEMDSFMRSCCNMISELTNYTALVALPEQNSGTLAGIQLLPINDYQILVILLTSGGIVRHKRIETMVPLSAEELARIELKMQQHLCGTALKDISHEMIQEMLSEYQMREKMAKQAFEMLQQAISGDIEHKIYTGGMMNMLSQPEFHDIDKLKDMFSLIDEEKQVEKLLDSADSHKISVTIGGEMPIDGAKECSMVVSNYFVNGEKAGSIGVLGPTRLNYDRTVSIMETIAKELSQAMSDKEEK